MSDYTGGEMIPYLHLWHFNIPTFGLMLWLAAVGALVNLAVLGWIWKLRAQPSAQWRRREIPAKEKRSEMLQVALAVLTLVLVGLEVWTHPMVHRTGEPPAVTRGQ